MVLHHPALIVIRVIGVVVSVAIVEGHLVEGVDTANLGHFRGGHGCGDNETVGEGELRTAIA